METQVMLGGHPVDPFFIEFVCVFLILFGSLSLLGLCWQWVVSSFASEKHAFGNLYQEIVDRRDEISLILDKTPTTGNALVFIGRLMELQQCLSALGIKTPTTLPSINKPSESRKVNIEWTHFLMKIAPDARNSNLDVARERE